ncbi:HlyD family secretion protein [Pelosinus fermentans]|uniref:Multidrug resistance protein MdtA-like barrel-sandwich hybrid domain-containing protein n=1 Tax=Pelosinus fermentans JBW45 TaxID=1192197 RepID=I9NRC1_9FIRM|nr:efflux RND transporter periplasmic adaptor subunit [Pelosinus fermentans]AJQ26605.1 hypothetical protein JBW_01253 [Pelosinus fermentans JBW45]
MYINSHKLLIKFISTTLLLLLVSICSGCDLQYDLRAFFFNEVILNGHVESNQISVNSEVIGKIIEIYKEEGQQVKKGDLLAHIDSTAKELEIIQMRIKIGVKEVKLKQLKAGTRYEQIQEAEAAAKVAKYKLDEEMQGARPEELERAALIMSSAQAEYEYYKDNYKKLKYLYAQDAIPERELIKAQQELTKYEINFKTAMSQLEQTRNGPTNHVLYGAQANYEKELAQLELLKNGPTLEEIRTAELELEDAKADLEQTKLSLSKCNVVSPVDGIYILKNANVGDTVNVGTNIGKISDLSDLYAKVYIAQKDVTLISLGQSVNLRSISLSGQLIKGKVIYIASQSEFLPEHIDKDEAEKSTVFEVKVQILDNIEKLRMGMTIEAYVPK